MPDITDDVAEELAVVVADAIPVLAARIPAVPAAQLGRAAAPHAQELIRLRLASPDQLAERLLGALELTVRQLDMTGAPDLSPYLSRPEGGRVGFFYGPGPAEAVAAASLLERVSPGIGDLVSALSRRLTGHPLVASLLAVPPEAVTEEAVAAAHGAAYLALAIAVASAAADQAPSILKLGFSQVSAAIGLGLGAAQPLLNEVPVPGAYETALLEKVRAEYLLPRSARGTVPAAGYRFALTEEGTPFPGAADSGGNGLVAVVPGGAVIRTGRTEGDVAVSVRVYAEPEPADTNGWDEVVEVSWHAERGLASVTGPQGPGPGHLRLVTPPWPGDYRLRVSATGRDDADDTEDYQLEIWQAPPGPEIVHKRTDRLGHRLRGEPEPDPVPRPERAYRWIGESELGIAATVTVVTGASTAEVVRAFGGDPERPESAGDLGVDDRYIAVLDAGTAVLVVENNGFEGTRGTVLERASAGGRAASYFWNVNAVTRLSFAEGGRVLVSYEPFGPLEEAAGPEAAAAAGPAVAAALEGLDFGDYRDRDGKGLVAVERFTGRGITPADLERIRDADTGYRVTPG